MLSCRIVDPARTARCTAAQIAGGLLGVGGGDPPARPRRRSGGDDLAGQAVSLGRGARVRSHMGQQLGAAIAGRQLEIEQVGDELDN
jgi:hypothetical protein